MKRIVVAAALMGAAVLATGQAEAKGCIRGAIVGGIAGHFAHHGLMGAAAGCAVGHHYANKAPRDQQTPPDASQTPPPAQ